MFYFFRYIYILTRFTYSYSRIVFVRAIKILVILSLLPFLVSFLLESASFWIPVLDFSPEEARVLVKPNVRINCSFAERRRQFLSHFLFLIRVWIRRIPWLRFRVRCVLNEPDRNVTRTRTGIALSLIYSSSHSSQGVPKIEYYSLMGQWWVIN